MKATARLAAIVVIVTACNSLAADWPQYLGPDRNSTSPEKGLLRSWPESGPEVLWTIDLGWGIEAGGVYAPMVIWDIDADGRAEVPLKANRNDRKSSQDDPAC